ncbi:seleno protein W family protein [Dendryphion nanum]|uniref:Seleno protein W family protein n=1 Tax=Dendryphion nanum TaxID=256645 RepID=A0A9P9DWU1_9PLEO|nr:seleno protein W family protein [Dendryphion nanum]
MFLPIPHPHSCAGLLTISQFGQELLSTFGTQIGEIALIPATGGIFTVDLTYATPPSADSDADTVKIEKVLLWDRKTEGGFPETKVLKQRVRDRIDPGKDLGHSDRHGKKKEIKAEEVKEVKEEEGNKKTNAVAGEEDGVKRNPDGSVCEDCK